MKSTCYLGLGLVAVLSLGMLGCEVTSEKINIWKQSTKGAAKIRAGLRDTGQDIDIRIEAAQALAEMGLTTPLSKDLESLSPADRKTVSESLSKGLLTKMKGSNPNETTRVQLRHSSGPGSRFSRPRAGTSRISTSPASMWVNVTRRSRTTSGCGAITS